MIFQSEFVAVLDACVLYSAPLRDLLLQLAYFELYQAKWTDRIQAEWKRNLRKNRPDLKDKLDKVILQMEKAFPDANVVDYASLISSLTLPDKDDRHVLAAAIHCRADFIITFNLKDFPKSRIKKYGIKILHPDAFVLNLIDLDADAVFGVFKHQVSCLKDPPLSEEEVLRALERCGLVKTASTLRKML